MRSASLPLVGADGAHLLRVGAMLVPSWSLGLVVLGLLAAPQSSPSSGTGATGGPAASVQAEPRLVELSNGMRLLLASPDESGQSAACVGLVVGIGTE